MLEQITPVILTFNEEPNIERTLAALDWAHEIVVVDSGSTDKTLDILKGHAKVRLFHRPFDTHWDQWCYAVTETGIATEWILRLDADYILTPELVAELRATRPSDQITAYEISFGYAMFGHRLIASFYPSNTILFRKGAMQVYPRGHTEGWRPQGAVATLRGKIIHDDRKPQSGWVGSQVRYMALELDHLEAGHGGLKNWLRRWPPLMPMAALLYCLFGKGLILNGRAGIFYALQRCTAEMILSLMVLERRLQK